MQLIKPAASPRPDPDNYHPQPYAKTTPAPAPRQDTPPEAYEEEDAQCNTTAAKAMMATANALANACPGYWQGFGAEPFSRMVSRSRCMDNARDLAKQARAMSCVK